MSGYYVLVDREPVKTDRNSWAKAFENHPQRRVAETAIGDIWVSTVFLGLDHRFIDEAPPPAFRDDGVRGRRLERRRAHRPAALLDLGGGRGAARRRRSEPAAMSPDACHCARCQRAIARYPADPFQLALPMRDAGVSLALLERLRVRKAA